ncbi:MAG: CoA transferase [Rhodospirillaceae bacterium]|mgnify:CR=1 FL=1|nr:CoA transferase [Rhodospirillaceae bacterium]|tara:strand:+ start:568 stop:1791 length:1224 start_codon:yes stop_codon:yes gene_type:complete
MFRPLSHIRVLDMSRILAGPWAAQTLADLGAEVIKIERPGPGDDTRSWGPPFVANNTGSSKESAYFMSANRGKKSVALDISKPQGQKILKSLVSKADILIENYKVGGLSRYGLGYEDLKKVNPGLIYCSITGFGQSGPLSNRAGYDFLVQAMGGLMSVTGEADGKAGAGPQKIGVALTDILTGLYTGIAALSALSNREKSSEGCHIDMALLDVTAACMANQAMNFLVTGKSPVRMGNAHPNIVPYEAFATADQYVIIAVGNDAQFKRFASVVDMTELSEDPKFKTNSARVENRDELIPLIQKSLKKRTAEEWINAFEEVGVPCGPINNMEQVFVNEQMQHRGVKIDMEHKTLGKIPQVASPIKFAGKNLAYERAPPALGQDTKEVLFEIADISDAEMADLFDKKIIA